MEQYPGFHFANVDQKARIAANQEHVNRRVLSEYIKVIGVPNKDKLGLRELVQKFLKEIVKYNTVKDSSPLTWPTSTGSNGDCSSFRAKMSDQFWTYFTSDGRKKLLEYNRKEHANVKVIRDQTISLSDLENLSLYLRRKIKQHYQSNSSSPPDVSVKNGYVTIGSYNSGNTKRYRATELAVLLGWDYKDWQGTAIRELLTNTERKNMMEGTLTWGSLSLDSFKPIRSDLPVESSNVQDAVNVPSGGSDESIDKDSSRKRSGTEDENTNPVKMHKPE
ncbi:hypothetical protein Aduo_011967 [Ancylostoma duodenale]